MRRINSSDGEEERKGDELDFEDGPFGMNSYKIKQSPFQLMTESDV